jgi:hypothetical protein
VRCAAVALASDDGLGDGFHMRLSEPAMPEYLSGKLAHLRKGQRP